MFFSQQQQMLPVLILTMHLPEKRTKWNKATNGERETEIHAQRETAIEPGFSVEVEITPKNKQQLWVARCFCFFISVRISYQLTCICALSGVFFRSFKCVCGAGGRGIEVRGGAAGKRGSATKCCVNRNCIKNTETLKGVQSVRFYYIKLF